MKRFGTVLLSALALVAVACQASAQISATTALSTQSGTSRETCVPRAQPLTVPEATILAAHRQLHPDLAEQVGPIDPKWARRYVAEAFLYTSGSLGEPYQDLPDGARQYALEFVSWRYDGQTEGRPTSADFGGAWRQLGAALVSNEGVADQDIGNCALVVLRSKFRDNPYGAGDLYADFMAVGFGSQAERGLRSLTSTAITNYLATPEGAAFPEGALSYLVAPESPIAPDR